MKLSAPPPPPPEPPEPGPDPAPNADAALVPAPGADAPGSPGKPLTWPGWFAGVDAVLAALAVGVAFLAASFVARNSDLWLHLGAGRMLTTGEYTPGSDPLSYTAADRPWVNHAWLWDLGAFLLYAGDGSVLVVAKALAAAAAFAVLLAIRRPGQPLWPWVAVGAVAVVATAPRLTLNPIVGSVLFFAVTLYVLFRVPSRPGSWRVPLLIGGTFWLWSNVDHWFIVGPAALGLLLLGRLGFGLGPVGLGLLAAGPTDEPDDPLPLPDVTTLARALLVGIAACMLNPHHFRVWQLPFELVGATDGDPRLAPLRWSPLSTFYWGNEGLGENANGAAYALLLLAGLYAAFLSGAVGRLLGRPFDVDPLPLPHASLWFGLAALSGLSVFAVPFLAVATVPLVASRFNVFSGRVEVGGPNGRLWVSGSVLGRVLTGLGLVALGVAAWPGWLHPPASNWARAGAATPLQSRRVEWAVEPDAELARAAGWLGEQRAAGRLPADARGLIASIDLANYCAWFAPGERVFANARYTHHRPELPALAAVRRGLGLVVRGDDRPDPAEAKRVLADYRVSYAAVAAPAGVSESVPQTAQVAAGMWANADNWATWYLDGRATIAGWRAGADAAPEFEALRIDPAALAFGPGAEAVKAGRADPPAPPRGWLDDFLGSPKLAPATADEALGWVLYKRVMIGTHNDRQLIGRLLLAPAPAPGGANTAHHFLLRLAGGTNLIPAVPFPPDGTILAAPVLAVRAARRAIADNPDHPDGYYALAVALDDPTLPFSNHEREVGRITALRQCLDRIPPPAEFRRAAYLTPPAQAYTDLAGLYLGQQLSPTAFRGTDIDLAGVRELAGEMVVRIVVGKDNRPVPPREGDDRPAADRGKGERDEFLRVPSRVLGQGGGLRPGMKLVAGPALLPLDLAYDALAKAVLYLPAETGGAPTPDARQRLQGLEAAGEAVDKLVRQAAKNYQAVVERAAKPTARQQYETAKQAGLVGKALDLLKVPTGEEFAREFGPEPLDVALQKVALELAVGRVDAAAADIAALKEAFDQLGSQSPPPPQTAERRTLLRLLEYQKLWLEGDYLGAGRALEELDGRIVAAAQPSPPPYEVAAAALIWPTGVTDLGLVAGPAVWLRVRDNQYRVARDRTVGEQDQAAKFFLRRGLLSLLGGNNADALDRFRQTRRPAPPGWGLPEMVIPIADEYLRLIDAAQKKAGGK